MRNSKSQHKIIAACFILILLNSVVFGQDKLFVFFPNYVRPQVVQDKMQNCFNGVSITVFGRVSDFTAKIEIEPPEAILTRTSLVSQLGNYDIVLQGTRKGKVEETYVLLSINGPVDIASVGEETVIGVIDVLGRNGMNTFVSQFFPKIPKLKRVTKVEDLLPLLSFNMASAILIEEASVSYFKTTSNLKFTSTALPATKDGIVALGIRKGVKADKCITALKKADKELSSFFEVEAWK